MAERFHRFTYSTRVEDRVVHLAGLRAPLQKAADEQSVRVVIIPGSPSRETLFKRLLSRAPADMDISMVLRPGYLAPLYGGHPQKPIIKFEAQAEAMLPAINEPFPGVTLAMGVSYGAAIALTLALNHPDQVHGVLTTGALGSEPRGYIRSLASMGGVPGLKETLPNFIHTARAEVVARRTEIGPLFERLRGLCQPVTLLHGDKDNLVPLSCSTEFLDALGHDKDVEFRQIRRGTHYLEFERPNLVIDELRKLKDRAARYKAQVQMTQSEKADKATTPQGETQ